MYSSLSAQVDDRTIRATGITVALCPVGDRPCETVLNYSRTIPENSRIVLELRSRKPVLVIRYKFRLDSAQSD